ncbi:MAG: hypothetical protein KAQ71_18770 [Desulfobulbaceae bacterium]|nr:hypothetical protein [Desulfobulbaceae bacterium]
MTRTSAFSADGSHLGLGNTCQKNKYSSQDDKGFSLLTGKPATKADTTMRIAAV